MNKKIPTTREVMTLTMKRRRTMILLTPRMTPTMWIMMRRSKEAEAPTKEWMGMISRMRRTSWASMAIFLRNVYVWMKAVLENSRANDTVFTYEVLLSFIEKIELNVS